MCAESEVEHSDRLYILIVTLLQQGSIFRRRKRIQVYTIAESSLILS